MDNDELNRAGQAAYNQNRNIEHVQPHQVGSYQVATEINNGIEQARLAEQRREEARQKS